MKKFLLRAILFLLILYGCDYAIGMAARYFIEKPRGGMSLKHKEIHDTVKPDIVILGSSRAVHHYNPYIIGDMLNAEAYNMGIDGNGILLMYPYLANLLKRHVPKVVIYDFFPEFDLHDDDLDKYTEHLLLMKGCPEADSVMTGIDPALQVKSISHIFPYNSQFPSILKCFLFEDKSLYKGYTGIYKELPAGTIPKAINKSNGYSSLKSHCLEMLTKICDDNNIVLIITISPFYGTLPECDINYIKTFCYEHRIRFISYVDDQRFEGHHELFADTHHLNHKGADIFSRSLSDSIRKTLLYHRDRMTPATYKP